MSSMYEIQKDLWGFSTDGWNAKIEMIEHL